MPVVIREEQFLSFFLNSWFFFCLFAVVVVVVFFFPEVRVSDEPTSFSFTSACRGRQEWPLQMTENFVLSSFSRPEI